MGKSVVSLSAGLKSKEMYNGSSASWRCCRYCSNRPSRGRPRLRHGMAVGASGAAVSQSRLVVVVAAAAVLVVAAGFTRRG